MTGRRAPAHPALPLPRRLVRVLRPGVQPLLAAVCDARQHRAVGGAVARHRVGAHHAWDVRQPLQQRPEGLLRGGLIPPTSDQAVEDGAVPVDGAPQGVRRAVEGNEHRVKLPRVARSRASATARVGVGLTELLAPPPDRLVGADHPTLGEALRHVPRAQGKPAVPPHGRRDDRRREVVTGVGRGRETLFPARVSHADNVLSKLTIPHGRSIHRLAFDDTTTTPCAGDMVGQVAAVRAPVPLDPSVVVSVAAGMAGYRTTRPQPPKAERQCYCLAPSAAPPCCIDRCARTGLRRERLFLYH